MESKSEKWQLKKIGTLSFISDECDNMKKSDKAFFENIVRDIFSDIITDFKELEVCQHPYKYLERNENGLFCNKCKTQISSDPNIY